VIGVIPQLKDDTERITIFGIQVRETKNPNQQMHRILRP
jgi:hypothetical protein